MGICPVCFESWTCKQEFIEHLEQHGLDPWLVKQKLGEWSLRAGDGIGHGPADPCHCRMYGNKFECEMRKQRTPS